MTMNGAWGFGDARVTPGGSFDANIHGVLDPQAGTLAGEWQITSGSVPGACTGTWTTELTQ